jgi:hypothetical protein
VSDGSVGTTFHVRPRVTAVWLGAVAVSLVGTSVVLGGAKLAGIEVPVWLVDLFRLNQEQNLPSFFSGCLFVIAAMLAFGLASRRPTDLAGVPGTSWPSCSCS